MTSVATPFVGHEDTYYLMPQADGTFVVFGNLWAADQDECFPTETLARARCEELVGSLDTASTTRPHALIGDHQ